MIQQRYENGNLRWKKNRELLLFIRQFSCGMYRCGDVETHVLSLKHLKRINEKMFTLNSTIRLFMGTTTREKNGVNNETKLKKDKNDPL